MYSAFARMRLYQSVYGLSTDRLYATVFMAWLAVVFAWFATTVLRGRGKRFVAGTFVSGWGTLIALNIADPAGLVARANIARANGGKELDVDYIVSLGADAAPALTRYLLKQPLTPPAEWTLPAEDPRRVAVQGPQARDDFTARCQAARRLLTQWGIDAPRDWRSWTVGRGVAQRVVAANEPALRSLAALPPLPASLSAPLPAGPRPSVPPGYAQCAQPNADTTAAPVAPR